MINNRNIKDMTLRERFDSRGFAVNKYAKAYGVNHSILSQVLDGVYSGRNINENGSTRRIAPADLFGQSAGVIRTVLK